MCLIVYANTYKSPKNESFNYQYQQCKAKNYKTPV